MAEIFKVDLSEEHKLVCGFYCQQIQANSLEAGNMFKSGRSLLSCLHQRQLLVHSGAHDKE